ncbi:MULTISPECIES: hypothetical protein [Ralstonia solanacearum species complex]|uniref:Outer membrane lipoprotein-sorting protein n=6 Tax=Ralstonia solanacearum species complex TaxID=3116862 RepID=A0A0S4V1K1_RALSL|nr:hypothetical protein LBM341_01935 [Ralstonia solanacearum]CAD16001.1 conserved hypothetical protein [Ralstonia pseudosolanacearum GMI1000]BEU47415.1 hypothetical protein MAFF211519_27400 [Ralstonia pseudosolanacearum]KAF3462221.1 outer membrane lipoprotein-sorting protein [Ralstonia solanacearum]NJZ68091.1 outer membrane lipoprotein-sorting protein [Ralstonia solanacearum]
MMRRIAVWALAACLSACAGETGPGAAGMPSVAQIVAKNAAARGGAEAWHRIDSMVWIGHVESSNAPARFVLAMRRPNKTRFEVVAMNRMALRVYDGTQGWKLRPMQRGEGPNVQPYTPDELKFAHDEQVIDGLLIDHAAKGIEIALEGTDDIEGRKAYRLNVRMPSGATRRVWIDAGTFLEVKYERETRGMAGQPVKVAVYYRNYQAIHDVTLPLVIESHAGPEQAADKLVIDKVQFNPTLDDNLFARPVVAADRSRSVQAHPDAGAAITMPHGMAAP